MAEVDDAPTWNSAYCSFNLATGNWGYKGVGDEIMKDSLNLVPS